MNSPNEMFDQTRPPAARLAGRRRSARGFTLLEMLVTIGILLILMGIVTVGLLSTIASNQRKQTEAILARAKSFTAEVSNSSQGRATFYQRTMRRIMLDTTSPAIANTNGQQAANSSRAAVLRSAVVMEYLLTLPANRSIAEKLPPRNASDMPSTVREPVMKLLDATNASLPLRAAPNDRPNGQLIANCLMDAWGNPIMFVADRFETVNVSGMALPEPNLGGLTGLTSSLATPPSPFRAPDGGPFWFSAGPDGNYATHDDNIYSFN